MTTVPATLRQRAEYTHRFNAGSGRHGWLRLTPAYSRRIVEETLSRYPRSCRVLDPFCGTGTTALSAATRGHDAITADINPFLVWFSRVKTSRYEATTLESARSAALRANKLAVERSVEPGEPPPIHNISRWWNAEDLDFLVHLKAALAEVAPEGPVSDLLRVAFCRLVVRLSNAAFNHQSMSFRNRSPMLLSVSPAQTYAREVATVTESALDNPVGRVEVIEADARAIAPEAVGAVDLVITSPPYANRMSYVRELRPYMYWLDYFSTPRDAGELDWLAVGGTWGIATSRLSEWEPDGAWVSEELEQTLARIRATEKANAETLARYVAKYFEDMTGHFRALRTALRSGARIHYIVGNSVFYGVLTPTERIYAALLRKAGFSTVSIRPIRKRNSKRELVEFEVSGSWY